VLSRPEPHPLDFDWRFTATTAAELAERVRSSQCLAVGTPSVAEVLGNQSQITLVDRHPVQLYANHVSLDPSRDPPIRGGFQTAVIDPPWYPDVYMRWLSWAANVAGRGALMWVTLWPTDTRSTAEAERSMILTWAAHWATVTLHSGVLRYRTPLFEVEALRSTGTRSRAPRTGDLVELRVHDIPPLLPAISAGSTWARFVLGDYQLALRLRPEDKLTTVSIQRHPFARGWQWPSVSKRANGRDEIDLWSSRNEVAIVRGSAALHSLLQHLARTGLSSATEPEREQLGGLTTWQIPVEPWERVLEWTHQL
jgi:hypothetical protein